ANIPLLHMAGGRMAPNPAFQAVVEGNYAKDAKIVVGCKAGGRSLQAATLMEAAGYTSVVDMRGGYHGERDQFGRVACAGWAESSLPVEQTAPPERTYAELEKHAAPRRYRPAARVPPLRTDERSRYSPTVTPFF